MKTNRILTAAALPLFFAACSQETLLDESVISNDYSNIPTVDVEFSANTSAGSRMGTQWGWEVGDRVGIAWLGIEESTPAPDGQAYQNNILTCIDTKASAFKSEGMLYVGDYFAYLPYSEKTTTVDYIPFTVEGQELTTNPNDVAKHAIYITPKITTLVKEANNASDQEAGVGKNVQLYLSKLSNAVTFNVNFTNNKYTDLKVTKVEMNVAQADGTYNSLINNFDYKTTTGLTTSTEWSSVKPTEFLKSYTTTGNDNQQNACAPFVLVSEEGLAVANNKLTTYAVMLPARTTDSKVLTATVTTNYGEATATVAIQGYEKEEWKNAPIITSFGQTGTINLTVDASKFNFTTDQTIVSNQAELEDLLNRIATSGKTEATTVSIKSDVKEFKLKDFTLPEGLKSDITLTSNNDIQFDGTNVINKNLKLSANNVNITSGTLTVNEDQTFAVDKASSVTTVAAGATLVNNGIVDFKNTYFKINGESEDKTKPAGLYISNNKKATISGFSIENDGEIKWVAGNLNRFSNGYWGVIFAEVKNFNEIKNVNEFNDASYGKVNTLRFVEATEFSNDGADITINNITTVDVLAPVIINIKSHSITEDKDVIFNAATTVNIAENASLTVNSDNKANGFDLPSSSTINVSKDASLTMKNLVLSGGQNGNKTLTIKNEGNVELINVNRPASLKIEGEGSTNELN